MLGLGPLYKQHCELLPNKQQLLLLTTGGLLHTRQKLRRAGQTPSKLPTVSLRSSVTKGTQINIIEESTALPQPDFFNEKLISLAVQSG